jgi:hypothetical protein
MQLSSTSYYKSTQVVPTHTRSSVAKIVRAGTDDHVGIFKIDRRAYMPFSRRAFDYHGHITPTVCRELLGRGSYPRRSRPSQGRAAPSHTTDSCCCCATGSFLAKNGSSLAYFQKKDEPAGADQAQSRWKSSMWHPGGHTKRTVLPYYISLAKRRRSNQTKTDIKCFDELRTSPTEENCRDFVKKKMNLWNDRLAAAATAAASRPMSLMPQQQSNNKDNRGIHHKGLVEVCGENTFHGAFRLLLRLPKEITACVSFFGMPKTEKDSNRRSSSSSSSSIGVTAIIR